MGHAPLCAQDGNDRSEEDGNKMIALLGHYCTNNNKMVEPVLFFKSKKKSWY
jgi:hypothetical protein